jgi:hypothetical protein
MSDVTQAQFDSIMPQYDTIRKSILKEGGKTEEEGMLTFFADTNSPIYMEKDWKIVQYILQQILKTEEKQLDGMYNLPSGASFYVPFQAWAMDRETREASATGEVELDSSTFDASSQNIYRSIDNFSQYVDMFGRYVMGIDFGNNADNKEFRLKAGEIRFGEKHPDSTDYDTVYGQPKYTGPRGATAINPYVDEYGRPKIGPGGGTNGAMAAGSAPVEPSPNSGVTGGLDFTKDVTLNAIIDLINALRTLLSPGAGQDNVTDPQTYSIPQTNEMPTVTTALSLNLQSQTQLIVDGRTLADIIKPYLYEDMVAYEGGAGSATSNYVMA